MAIVSEELELGGKIVLLETGRMAKAADGAVLIQSGDTTVLVTAVISKETRKVDFLPLTVDVEEKMYAAGKIPGGFIKREGRPSERSILTARLIDRPIRPSFPKGFRNDVQIIATVLSVDIVNPPDILALNGASAALTISDIPFESIGAVRICRAKDKWIINPTYQELEYSDLDLVVAGNKDSVLMVEATAKEIKEEDLLDAFEEAHKAIRKMIDFQEKFKEKVAPVQRPLKVVEIDPEIEEKVRQLVTPQLKEAVEIEDRAHREEKIAVLEKEVLEKLSQELEEEKEEVEDLRHQVFEASYRIEKEILREKILAGRRSDGRKPEEIRPISSEVGILPRTHGSGLFTRGGTQVLSVVTLGTVGEEQRIDGLGAEESKKFLHHYNFAPFSTGDTWPLRGPKRREIGHGALAEKALFSVIPEEPEFPYTIRIVSEVLESNGSTSMASVCAGCLALMDAGVPIKTPVAGIAMGLVKQDDKKVILMDILGEEDAIGDMDFKVAGTNEGITALQMDIKLKEGLDRETLKDALYEAKKGREFILNKMAEAIPGPREKISQFAPRIIALKIDKDKIREVIGPGGKVIHSIIEETGVTIDIEDDGTVYIASKDEEMGEKARQIVEMITKVVEVGEKYVGTVKKTTPFGAFVEILPGREGLVHISRLSEGHVRKVEDVVKVGDKLVVEVVGIDERNRISLAASRF
ncbi:MAG TPA: polyribonucleotide nucleotidyltransferase [Candidatus Subteraquimicrobiales bacterium]